jgi:hypothetical protein
MFYARDAVPFAAFKNSTYRASSTSWRTGYMAEVLSRHRAMPGGYPVGFKRYYGIEDLKKFKEDFIAFLGPNVDSPEKVKAEEVEAWGTAAETAAAAKFEPYSDLERFFQERKIDEHIDRRRNKAARAVFFQKKAAELDPPMTRLDLLSRPAYQRFIDIPNPPSELSWLQLQKRMTEEEIDPSRQSGSRAKKVALARANYHKSMAGPGKIGVRGARCLDGLDGNYDLDFDDIYFIDTEDEREWYRDHEDGDDDSVFGYNSDDSW